MKTKTLYLSLLGAQTPPVLQPLLLHIREKGAAPDVICLLGTPEAWDKFEPICDDLEKKPEYGKTRLLRRRISRTLETDSPGNPPAQEAVAAILPDYPDHDIVFNVSGGMNFQLAACIRLLIPADPLFVYPDFDWLFTFRIENGKVAGFEKKPLPEDKLDIFSLQGIAAKPLPQPPPPDLVNIMKTLEPEAADTLLFSQEIDGVVFDLTWNRKNTQHFLKIIKKNAGDSKRLPVIAAGLIRLAENRDSFGDLHHRRIHVLTSDAAAYFGKTRVR